MEQGFSVSRQDPATLIDRVLGILASRSAQIAFLIALVLLTYLRTLDVPFYLDDYHSIRDNPAIRDPGNLAEIRGFGGVMRILGYLSFALNYATGAYELAGYHAVNIAIHALTTLVVFFLTLKLCQTRALSPHCSPEFRTYFALLTAVLFAVHPLQTQAVTYIVQRLASMTALFYLTSLLFYVHARLAVKIPVKLIALLLAGFFFTAAMLTKQNAATLPLVVLLCELCFLKPRKRVYVFLAVLALLGLAALVAGFRVYLNQDFFQVLDTRTVETAVVTRAEYLALQMQVLWSYILKFLLPFNLYLDYYLPIPERPLAPSTLFFASLHLLMIAGAAALLRRSPIISFGILFYYASHLVESSILPIRDFGFEHRTYLPNLGFCLVAAWLLLHTLPRYLGKTIRHTIIALLVMTLATLTWARNEVWRDPPAFFRHEIAVNPENLRAYGMLGEYHLRMQDYGNALLAYEQGAPLMDTYISKDANTELAFYSNYVLALDGTQNYTAALGIIDKMLRVETDPFVRAVFLSRRGIINAKLGLYEQAEIEFTEALALDGTIFDAVFNYAKVLIVLGKLDQANEMLRRASVLDPVNPEIQLLIEFIQNAETNNSENEVESTRATL
jgi:tetratricopeptide (TPR) repeat protein